MLNYPTSIIIPSNKKQILTLLSLRDISNIEIIVETIPNVSKARNEGSNKAKGEILAILDDDIGFSKEWFEYHVNYVRNGLALWNDPPCVIFMTKEDFVKTGGFDESIASGEVQDFFHRMRKQNITINRVDTKGLKSLMKPTNPRTDQSKISAMIYLRYFPPKKWLRIFRWQKNPLKLLKIGLWTVWWILHKYHE